MSQGRTLLPESRASSTLLTAALAGLMGAGLSACGTKEKEKIVAIEPVGVVTSTTVDKTLTLATFTTTCEARGGLVQTHASCGGANTCAGLSYHSSSGKLSEHTCKGTNICAGMSCVDLAEDSGLSGQAIYEGSATAEMGTDVQCTHCHSKQDSTAFILPIPPGKDAATAVSEFQAKPDSALIGAIAFGIHGVSNGIPYANMPGFYKVHSLAETKKLVAHIRTLTVEASAWTDPE